MKENDENRFPPIINIIGSPVTALPFKDQVHIILEWALKGYSRYVCVANTHMLVEAYKNKNFCNILNNADLITPDGMPLVWMMKLLGLKTQDRVAGIDILTSICQQAQAQKIPIFFVGSQSKILNLIRKRLALEFPNLKIAGMEPLPFVENVPAVDDELIQNIDNSRAKIVLVSLGCPKQEYWMARHKHRINAVMIGLGGAFPVYAGIQRRAPYIFRASGLEWLYRLLQEPGRLYKRYATTIPTFICLAAKQLRNKVKNIPSENTDLECDHYQILP